MSANGQHGGRSYAAGLPWVALLATGFGLLASALSPAPFAYTAQGLREGELWRLWTGHFVHYGSAHLWGDLLAFALWAWLVESESRPVLVATLLLGAPLISCLLTLGYPRLNEYRGLSALDVTLVIELIWLRGFEVQRAGPKSGLGPWLTRTVGRAGVRYLAAASLCLCFVKTIFEFTTGHALLAPDLGRGVTLLPAAHAFGALVGLLVCAVVGRPRSTDAVFARSR